MNWKDFLKETTGELGALNKQMPDVASGFQALAKAATKDGALDPKTKELIALAIGVAARCDACIGYHVKACIRHGATREEIVETIGMCVYMGGGPALMYGAKALKAFDDFTEAAQG